jgi:hypothetical protein|tara:strand:+ start:18617 stop:18910 length:294 start_codon:yes stop_codon:yes gene_type:complete
METKKVILQIIKKDLVSIFRPLLEYIGMWLILLTFTTIMCYIVLWVLTLGGYRVIFHGYDAVNWIPRKLEVALAILPYIAVPTIWTFSIVKRLKKIK